MPYCSAFEMVTANLFALLSLFIFGNTGECYWEYDFGYDFLTVYMSHSNLKMLTTHT